jgi:hypothetical protein
MKTTTQYRVEMAEAYDAGDLDALKLLRAAALGKLDWEAKQDGSEDEWLAVAESCSVMLSALQAELA